MVFILAELTENEVSKNSMWEWGEYFVSFLLCVDAVATVPLCSLALSFLHLLTYNIMLVFVLNCTCMFASLVCAEIVYIHTH